MKKSKLFSLIALALAALLVLSAISYRFMAKVWFLHLPVTLGLVLLTFVGPASIVYKPDGSDDAAWLPLPQNR